MMLPTGTVLAGKDKNILPPTISPMLVPTFSPSSGPIAVATELPTATPTIIQGPTKSPQPTEAPVPQPTGMPTITTSPTEVPKNDVPIPELHFILDTTGPIEQESIEISVVEFLTLFLSTGFYRESFNFVTLDVVLTDVREKIRTRGLQIGVQSFQVLNGLAFFDPKVSTAGGLVPIPTEEELGNIISAYFLLKGTEDLQKFLITSGLPVSGVSEVAVNGDIVAIEKVPGDDTNKSPPDSGTSSNTQKNIIAGTVIGGVFVFALVAALIRFRVRGNKSPASEEVIQRHQAPPMKQAQEIIVIQDVGSDCDDVDKSQKGKKWTGSVAGMSGDESSLASKSSVHPVSSSMSSYNANILSSTIPSSYFEKSNPYNSLTATTNPTAPEDEDDDDNADFDEYASDGDIISIAESMHQQDQQGPLFDKSRLTISSDPVQDHHNLMKGTASVRQPQESKFQYDASRLDQVISSAKGYRS